jgi:hypothetical protein
VCGRDDANKIISIQLLISRDQSWCCRTPCAAARELFDQKIFLHLCIDRGGLLQRGMPPEGWASESGKRIPQLTFAARADAPMPNCNPATLIPCSPTTMILCIRAACGPRMLHCSLAPLLPDKEFPCKQNLRALGLSGCTCWPSSLFDCFFNPFRLCSLAKLKKGKRACS